MKIRSALKTFIREGFHRVGLDIRRHRPEATEGYRLMQILQAKSIDLVLDVGANHGGYAEKIRKAGYEGAILSFEPQSKVHECLEIQARHDPKWTIAPRAALGDVEGEAVLHVAGNSSSSSLLQMLPAHQDAAPQSAYVGEETVPLRRLDTLVRAWPGGTPAARMLLKVDTQGYERAVLAGAEGLLSQIHIIQLELSLLPLYEGQWLLEDFLPHMKSLGFDLWSLSEVFTDPRSGRLLQVDGVFVRLFE